MRVGLIIYNITMLWWHFVSNARTKFKVQQACNNNNANVPPFSAGPEHHHNHHNRRIRVQQMYVRAWPRTNPTRTTAPKSSMAMPTHTVWSATTTLFRQFNEENYPSIVTIGVHVDNKAGWDNELAVQCTHAIASKSSARHCTYFLIVQGRRDIVHSCDRKRRPVIVIIVYFDSNADVLSPS